MRIYQLYLINDEFASHYFGKEKMFFQLFKEYADSSGEMKAILSRQINYITNPISSLKLHQYMYQLLQKEHDFRAHQGAYYIEGGRKSSAKLEVFEKYLIINAQGDYYAETVFFEVLRKNESSFLAIDLENDRYGWLRPVKERKFI